MCTSPVVSIIINNFNYDRFLSQAIDSALAQTYKNVEVIVVDDGSTDNSRDIIASYSDSIMPVLQPNGKQGAAFNNGFAHSKGDIIIFLDSDDYLYPNAVERIVTAWRPGTAKVHYRLAVVDSNSNPKGYSLPQGGTLDSKAARDRILQTGSCISVPTSGNALSRQVMDKVFPIPDAFNTTSDDYLSVLIPLHGEVVAIEAELGAYRIHDSNQWALVELDSSRFRRFITHDLQRCSLIKEYGQSLGFTVPEDLELKALGCVWSRLVSLKLAPGCHPVSTDRIPQLMFLGLKILWQQSYDSLPKRLLLSLWFVWVSLLPLSLAKPAIQWLFMPDRRPRPVHILKSKIEALFKPTVTQAAPSPSKRIRTLVVSQAYVVGVNQGKLAAIASRADIGLLAPKTWRSQGWNRTLTLETPYPEIEVYPANVIFSGRGGAYLFNPFKIHQVIRQFKPDVIQAEVEVFSLCALQLAIASRLTGIPLALFVWENMERQLPLPRRWVRDFVLTTAPLIQAGNCDGAEVLRKWNYRGLIEIIPQIGVDAVLFNPDKVIPSNGPVRVGFLGRIVPEKGIDLLIQAAQYLQQQGLSFEIIICGSGPTQPELTQMAASLGISEQIIWSGVVPHNQVPQELGKFDVLVLPSRSVDTWKEQFGHVLIEAMAMGIPAVGSTCGEIPNVISHPDLTFEEGDSSGLANILARLIQDKSFRNEMGQYCLERAQNLYTHERIAHRLILLWQKVLNGNSIISSTPSFFRRPLFESSSQK